MPWFSGLCLDGEVAKQYEMEPVSTPQQHWGIGGTRVLELDGLGPITIFVGANNSGKSRLMRELFKAQQPLGIKLKSRDSRAAEVDIVNKITDLIRSIGGPDNSLNNGWIVETQRGGLIDYIDAIYNVDALDNNHDHESLQKLKCNISDSGLKGGIRGLQQVKRCYVPILRGMRPPFFQFPKGEDRDEERYIDLYAKRTARDYFDNTTWTQMSLGSGPKNLIFTGLSLYNDLRKRLLGRTQADRDSARVYEDFLSENFSQVKV